MARQDLGPASTLTRITAFCLLVGFYLACTAKDELTSPSTAALGPDGQVQIMASPSNVRPSPSDIRPSPSNIRPSPSDIRPSPSDIRPSPSNIQPSASPVTGSTPTPSPSATPSASPTPSPTPTPGPTTRVFTGAPFSVVGSNGQSANLAVTGISTIQSVQLEVFFSATSPDLNRAFAVDIIGPGGTVGDASTVFDYSLGLPPTTGTQIGTSCGSPAVFSDSGSAVLQSSAAPYLGPLKPYGPNILSIFTGRSGAAANGNWQLAFYFSPVPLPTLDGIVACWTLKIVS